MAIVLFSTGHSVHFRQLIRSINTPNLAAFHITTDIVDGSLAMYGIISERDYCVCSDNVFFVFFFLISRNSGG